MVTRVDVARRTPMTMMLRACVCYVQCNCVL
jgi:hypothetical protein